MFFYFIFAIESQHLTELRREKAKQTENKDSMLVHLDNLCLTLENRLKMYNLSDLPFSYGVIHNCVLLAEVE